MQFWFTNYGIFTTRNEAESFALETDLVEHGYWNGQHHTFIYAAFTLLNCDDLGY